MKESTLQTIKDEIDKMGAKINAMTLRERALILITMLVIIYTFWSTILYGYLLTSVTASL